MASSAVLFALLGLAAANPAFGARGAGLLRGLLGSQATARLETAVFEGLDGLHQLLYRSGLERPIAPWQSRPAESAPAASAALSGQGLAQPAPIPEASPAPTGAEQAGAELDPALSAPDPEANPSSWPPAGISPLGNLSGEGVWERYIQGSNGRGAAYRTYLQPDPDRPYAVVAVVAFDLAHSRLNFVLGSEEPASPGAAPSGRSGLIPNSDRGAGALLAAFNGGFLSAHGSYGAMAEGLVALPPLDGLATVAIYRDGEVRIGAWGSEILPSEEMQAWRQNGPLILEDGQVTPKARQTRMEDWGGTLDGNVAVWRSALGLSADRRVLYYFAGDRLTLPALARAMQAAGVADGMQLDINAYWVHFTAIRWDGDRPIPEPLIPQAMGAAVGRYLEAHERDYFYVTAR